MSPLNITKEGPGNFVIEGNLTFATIDKQTLKSFSFLKSAKEITLDLAGVSSTDSAGLALMIEWIRYSQHNRTHIIFKNIPKQLLNLAKLSGFDQSSHFNEGSRETIQDESLDINI
ncbi:MAG: STAS domain-containing protein [Methylobacter sp.]|nr:STAS domain-containing protein [Methylobacter sp.]